MILKLHIALMAAGMLLTGNYSYGQAPDLGVASDFAVFTAAGAFNVAGASTFVTGDVGTNVGAFTGFPPGVLVGQIHVADAVSAAAATDVALAYGSLSTVTCGQVISVTMGNGQTLLPDVYCTGAASTINGDLILDAQGDPDAIFIFKIGGALATTVDSRIILVNGASLCNVYWQVNGQVDLGENSIFQGTLLVNGAINLLDGAELIGQALSQAGAISLQNNVVTIGEHAVASTITATSATSFCEGESVTLTGNVGGVWNTGAETSEIEVSTSGDFFVTNTTNCGTEVSNIISVTVNPPPACEISGGSTTCAGEPTQLCAPDGLASYLWSTGETSQCISVNSTGTFSVTITDGNGCSSSCSHDVTFVCDPVVTPVDPIVLSTCNAELPTLTAAWTDCGTSGTLTGEAALQSVDGCVETYLYTFSGTDACGESFGTTTTLTRTVDVSAPIITELPDFLLDGCNQPWPATLTTIWSDNCSSGGEVVGVAGAITTVDCLESRVYTFSVTDDCGNSASTTTTVTRVVDEAAPIIEPVADFQIAGCDQPWPEVISTTWSDNCSEGGIVIGVAGLVTIDGCGEQRIYTFSVTDECGNTAESFVTVTRVFDETAPTIVNSADYVLPGCNPDWPSEVLADWTDNCSAGGTLVGVPGEIITDGCSQSRSYTFSAMDECGNETIAVTIVTRIFDEANPVIEPIADFQLEGCNADWPVLVSLWTSNCAGGGNVTGIPGEVSIDGCIESREYTFTVNDDCGVSASTTTVVTRVVDEAAPVIEPVADFQIAGCDQPWPAVVSTTWSDNCSEGGELIADAGLVTVDGCGEERIYTFSVTDECGNTAESFVTVTRIFDETAPTILNPADYVLPGCNPDWPTEVLADWTDNCSAGGTLVGVPGEIITDGCSQSRSYTFSVMDECGNETIAVTIVTRIFDEANPVIEPIADFQLEGCNAEWPVLVSLWTSNCAGGGNVTGVPGEISIIGCLESRVYTFTVNDDCGVSASTTTVVTRVVDEAAPVIEPVADFQIAGCDQPWPEVVSTTWSDNCSEGGIVIGEAGLVTTDGCGEVRIYTFSVTDECGNTAESFVTVTRIFDETAPTIVNPADYVLPGCNPDWPLEVLADWTDNCSAGGTLIGVPGEIITDGCSQSRSYTFSVMDECGNEATATTIITRIFDEANPVIEPVADFQLEGCNAEWPVLVSLWTSNCAGGGNVTGVPGEVSIIGCLESRVYTFTVNDDCGVSASTTTVVTRVVDEAAPVIVPVADFQIAGCDQPWPEVVSTTWSDNCSEGGIVIGEAGLVTTDGCGEERIYTFSVTDECGNTAESSVTVTRIFDETPPTIFNPADYVLPGCNPDWPLEVLADWTDNCSAGGTLIGVPGEIITDGCSQSRSYTFGAMDECGNEATAITIITRIFDEANPVIEPIADFQLEGCNAEWPVLVSVWTSNCAGGGNVTGVPGEVSIDGCLESREYTFTVNDDCGVSASTTTVVTRVVDESAPVIEPVADFQIAGCDQPWPAVVSATWSDNCSDGGELIAEAGLVTVDGCGEQRLYTFSVTDECGNTAESFVTVTRIFDETAPTILNPADYVLPGCNPDWPSEVLADWTDNCSAGGTLVGIPGEIITDGCSQSRSYTFTVMDECGNQATAVTIITRIFDEANPVIEPIADFQLEGCNAEWPVLVSLWTSNCAGGGNVTGVPGEISIIGCLESREYTFTVNDDCGVSASTTTVVTRVVDEAAPVIEPVADFQIAGCDQPWPAVVSTTWSDNCSEGGELIADAGLVTVDGCGEERIYTFSVTDECGNTAQSSVTVTRIFDETAPTIVNPADYVLPGCNPDWPLEVLADWTDNCSAGGTLVGVPGEIITDGCSQSRSYTFGAMDECGNEAIAVTIVTRQFEETAPEIDAIADFQLELCNAPWPPFLTTTWSDDCGGGGVVEALPGEITTDNCIQTRPYTFDVTNDCGGFAQAVVWVSRIFDETSPMFGPIEPFTVQCDEFDAIPTPSVSDNCTLVELTFTDEPVSEICNYSFVRTWIATDDCFNTTTAEQIINVVDTVGPVFDNIESVITVACIEDVPVSTPTVYDECTGEIVDYQVSIIDGGGNPEEICVLTTAIGPGSDWALWLPTHYNNGFSSSANFVFDADGGTFDQFEDGTAHLYGTVVNDIDPSESYILDFWFENKRDWTEWSALGRSYKDDLSLAEAGGDLWTTWSYYELVNNVSTATGTGDLAGNTLYFQHMPASYVFGFQVGEAANNKNSNYGMSGWFSYTGVIDGANLNGYGDVNVDADCVIQQLDECINQTTYTIQYIAFDDCFNSTVFSQLVIVNDTIAPEFVDFPEDITVSCDEWPVVVPEVVAVDNCEGEVILEYFTQTTEGICDGDFIVTHTWIATDLCGNSSSATWTVSVADTIPPVITACPADAEYDCFADVPAADVALVTAFDDCNDVIITWEGDVSEGDECAGTILRTYSATDACGNYAECVQTITYDDNEAPVFVTLPTDITIDCAEDIPAPEDLSVTDNCGFFDLIIVTEEDGLGQDDDDCGQYRTQTPGGWGAPAAGNNSGVYRDTNFNGAFPGGLVIGCEGGFQLELTSAGAVEAFLPSGGAPAELTQNWIDPAGNVNNTFAGHLVAVTLSLTFDSYDPNFGDADGWLGDLLIASGDFAGMTVSEIVAIANDVIGGCSNAYSASALTGVLTTINENYVDGDSDNGDLECTPNFLSECEYQIIRTYTAVDECGNESSVIQTITVSDDTPPVIVCPEDMIVDCYENVPAADINLVEALDNCTDVIVTWEGDEILGDLCQGAAERTYRATDACGNYSECTQIITFSDTEAPVFAFEPEDLTLECGDEVPTMEEIPATDNCDPNPVVATTSSISISGDCPTIEVITRSWTATDACGNITTISQTISIQDAGIPSISCPENVDVECYSDVPEPNVQLVSASDDCSDVVVTWEGDEMAGDSCAGTITRTYRATDACGNYAECTQMITYSDDEAPELIMPQDTSFTADCGYFQGDDAQAYLNGEMTPADSAAFVAYVQSLFASQGLIPLDVVDNCDPDSYWEETSIDILVDVDCPLIYQINCNFQAFDNCGNVSEVETTYLFITDDQPPVIECPSNLTLVCPSEIPAPNTDWVVAFDECSDAVVTWEGDETEGDECTGTILRTYRATDACGNYAECVQVITYSDDEAPVFVDAPADATYNCNDSIPALEDCVAIDNCSSEITYTAEEFVEGYTGEDGLTQCDLTTPLDVVGAAWAVWLPNNIGEPQYYHLNAAGGQFVELPNGRAHLTGTVYAPSNPNKRWIIDVYFKDRADWEEWGINLGRGYKDDASVAEDNYLDWDYYILNSDSATLTGDGAYVGSELTLAHAPASYYFGFQVGVAANNRNAADGMSGWFFYNGSWIGNEGMNGIGDFGFEKECLECDYTITRIWTATDYCGNTNTAVQVITVEPGEDDNENLDAANPDKVPAVVLGAWPNPTAYRSTITFEIPEPSRVTLEVFNMDGKLIETLYQGDANSEQEYFFEFNADQLSNGMYIYKLTTDKAAYIDKLMIAR